MNSLTAFSLDAFLVLVALHVVARVLALTRLAAVRVQLVAMIALLAAVLSLACRYCMREMMQVGHDICLYVLCFACVRERDDVTQLCIVLANKAVVN